MTQHHQSGIPGILHLYAFTSLSNLGFQGDFEAVKQSAGLWARVLLSRISYEQSCEAVKHASCTHTSN